MTTKRKNNDQNGNFWPKFLQKTSKNRPKLLEMDRKLVRECEEMAETVKIGQKWPR